MLEVLEVLVVLVMLGVLEELLVYVGGIFERVKSLNFFLRKFKIKKIKLLALKTTKKTKSKIYLHFRVLHSIIPFLDNVHCPHVMCHMSHVTWRVSQEEKSIWWR